MKYYQMMFPWELQSLSKTPHSERMWRIFTFRQHDVNFTYTPTAGCLSVSAWFNYPDYKNYYGPSSICHIIRFIRLVKKETKRRSALSFYCDRFDLQRANTIFLLCAFMVVEMGMKPEEAITRVHPVLATVPSFRTEGSFFPEDYCELSDCVRALHKAVQLGWLKHVIGFDGKGNTMVDEKVLSQMEELEDPENGDISWIIPGKLLAMAGPLKIDDPKTFRGAPDLHQVMDTLTDLNVGCIVRLNRPHYQQSDLPDGIKLVDFFVHDGSVPNEDMVKKFHGTVKKYWKQEKVVAVHCRAGLGRTGTFIGTILLDWFGFTATEAIAYLRIARPGMVLGDQSLYLKSYGGLSCVSSVTINAKKGKHGPKQHQIHISSAKKIKLNKN